MIARIAVVLALLLPLAASPAGAAGPCDLGPIGRVSQGGYYVEQRVNGDVWVYEESNGIPKLQRGGVDRFGERDPCIDDPLVLPDAIFL